MKTTRLLPGCLNRGLLAHVNDNVLAGSLIESNPVRGDDATAEFQGMYAAASGMRITHLHVYRGPIGADLRAESRPLARDARIEDQLPARAAQAEQTFDAESP